MIWLYLLCFLLGFLAGLVVGWWSMLVSAQRKPRPGCEN